MNRNEIIEKLDSLYDEANKNNIGLNETELEYKESVADWICSLYDSKPENSAIDLLKRIHESDMCSITADEDIHEFLKNLN